MKKLVFFICAIICSTLACPAQQTVDLGLSVCWSDINWQSENKEDPGAPVWWGDVSNSGDLSVWANREPFSIAGSELDIVAITWGDGWRMPTSAEIQELIDNCKSEVVYNGGAVAGVKFTGANGNSIFLPAGGAVDRKNRDDASQSVCIWSGTFNHKYGSVDFMLCDPHHQPHIRQASPGRYQFCVRPVRNRTSF